MKTTLSLTVIKPQYIAIKTVTKRQRD